MRLAGIILLVAGALILAMRGISYTKERQAVRVGGLEFSAERKGYIPPLAGAFLVVSGAALIFAAKRRPRS